MTPIMRARMQRGLKLSEVAAAIGRPCYFLMRAETGLQLLTDEEEAGILRAIKCLAAFATAMAIKRQEFIGTLKLPPRPARPSNPHNSLPGN